MSNQDLEVLILDTGGGESNTITVRAWDIVGDTGERSLISGYQNQGDPKSCRIVNGITNISFGPNEDDFLVGINRETLVEDDSEMESI